MPRPSTSRLDPGCIPVSSTSEKALHDLRSHTSGGSLPPPVRGELAWRRRRATPGGAGTSCRRLWVPRPSTSRLDPGCIPVPSTSEKALHDLRSHTSGSSLTPPVTGELAWPHRRATLSGAGTSCRRLWMPRPSTSRLYPGCIPVPSTSEKALHDLRSHTSGGSLPPPVRASWRGAVGEQPLVERVRAVGGSGCHDLRQAG